MDALGHIYQAPEDEIPSEDAARLDGYLKARAETDLAAHQTCLEERKQALAEVLDSRRA